MKKIVLSILIIIGFNACQKNNDHNSLDNQELSKTDLTSGIQNLNGDEFVTDSLTEAFILKSTEVEHSFINIDVIQTAIADDIITDVEMSQVAIVFGFSSTDQFIKYLSDFQDLKSQLTEKYKLNEKDSSEVKLLFENAMLSYLNKLAAQLNPDLNGSTNLQTTGVSCGEALALCASTAYTFQIGALSICNAGWVYPPVAVLCYAGVMTSTYFMLQGCSDSYDLCQMSQPGGYPLAQSVKITFYGQ